MHLELTRSIREDRRVCEDIPDLIPISAPSSCFKCTVVCVNANDCIYFRRDILKSNSI